MVDGGRYLYFAMGSDEGCLPELSRHDLMKGLNSGGAVGDK